MTASTISSPARRTGRATTSRRLSGFGPLFRKDIGEWSHGKRAWVILIVTTLFLVLTAANGCDPELGHREHSRRRGAVRTDLPRSARRTS